MFITSQGHSEGAIEPLYLLITTMRMYLLTRGAGETKYRMHASIKYTELDFISVSSAITPLTQSKIIWIAI